MLIGILSPLKHDTLLLQRAPFENVFLKRSVIETIGNDRWLRHGRVCNTFHQTYEVDTSYVIINERFHSPMFQRAKRKNGRRYYVTAKRIARVRGH